MPYVYHVLYTRWNGEEWVSTAVPNSYTTIKKIAVLLRDKLAGEAIREGLSPTDHYYSVIRN